MHPPKKERRGKETCLTTHVLHRKLPLDTRPIRRPIRWIICPFVSIESAQQLRYGAPQQLQHHRARTQLRPNIWGSKKTYLQSAISGEPQPHSGSPRSSPGQSVQRLSETTFLF